MEEKTNENYKNLLMKVDTDIEISSVILSSRNREKISNFIKEIKNREKLKRFNLKPMNRLLFYGASGCGKTYLGKALSNHLNYTMLYVDIAQSLASGNASKNLSEIFEIANFGKHIIFLDEVDSIAWDRDSDNAEMGDIRRATNTLFQLMDQMSEEVIVISATNMLHKLDPAFERRFDLKLEFQRPKLSISDTIESFLNENFTLIKDRHDEVTENRSKLSFAEYKAVAERMMKKAVLSNTLKIKMSDVYIEIANTMNVKISFQTDSENFYKTL